MDTTRIGHPVPVSAHIERVAHCAWEVLPKGGTLPAVTWERRHRAIRILLWLHVAGIFIFAFSTGNSLIHSLAEAAVVGVIATLAGVGRWSHRQQASIVSSGLLASSAILVHLSGGYVELHFHFFVMLAVIALYQDWVPFLLAIGYVVLHHGVIGTRVPTSVYNHPDAWAHPWRWAAIHGVFVLASSAASIASWRLSEQEAARRVREQLGRAEAEAKYRTLVEHIPAMTYIAAADDVGALLYQSPQIAAVLGYTADEWLADPKLWLTRLHPDDRERVLAHDAHTNATGQPFSLEYRYIARDGRIIWVRDEAALVRDAAGHPQLWQGVTLDITEHKQLQEAVRLSEARLSEAQRIAHLGSWEWDLATNHVQWSDETFRILGVCPHEVNPTYEVFMRLVHPDERERVTAAIAAALTENEPYRIDVDIVQPDGSPRVIHAQGEVMCDAAGQPTHMIGTLLDITERKRTEHRLAIQYTVSRILAEAATIEEATSQILNLIGSEFGWDVGRFWHVDPGADVLRCTANWHTASLSPAEVEAFSQGTIVPLDQGRLHNVWASGQPRWSPDMLADPDSVRAPLAALAGLHANFSFPILLGSEMSGIIEFFSRKIRQPDHHLLAMSQTLGHAIGQFLERKRLEEALTHKAFHDALTGLPNRSLFLDRLEHALARRQRAGETIAVIFLDLDNFKVINDTLGHDVGDQLLVAVARRLSDCVRAYDTIARLGGDEFTVLLEDVTDEADIMRAAARITAAFERPFAVPGHDLVVTASVGIAGGSAGTEDAADLLRQADLAMYQAKHSGKAITNALIHD